MFSANPSISPTGLKPSDVANGVRQGERGRTGGTGSDLAGNAVGLWGTGSDWAGMRVGTRSDWGGTGSDWGGNEVGLERERGRTVGNEGRTGWERGSDWGVGLEYKRWGPAHLAPLFASDAPRPPAST